MNQIQEKLNQLANARAMLDVLQMKKQEAIDSVLTPEIRAELEAIEAEFTEQAKGGIDNAAAIEAEIKALVAEHGESVKGDFLHAVYSKPRVTWDSKGLDGFAVAHPEIEKFRKVGSPSVSIRTI